MCERTSARADVEGHDTKRGIKFYSRLGPVRRAIFIVII